MISPSGRSGPSLPGRTGPISLAGGTARFHHGPHLGLSPPLGGKAGAASEQGQAAAAIAAAGASAPDGTGGSRRRDRAIASAAAAARHRYSLSRRARSG